MVFLNAAAQQGSMWPTIIMLVAIFAIMYFMMIRPQRKQQKKKIDNFRNGLQVGQEVVTAGGIYGKIKSIENGIVMLEVAHNVVIRVDVSVIYPNPAAAQASAQ